MRTEGITGAAIPDTRGVPLPGAVAYANHETGRPARDPLAASPFRGQPVVEFTREQLAAAGYHVPGAPKPKVKRKRISPVHTGPRPDARRFDHDQAVAAYLEGEASTAIAKRLGVTTTSILNAVRAAGHKVRVGRPATKRERAPREPRPVLRKFDYQQTAQDYLAGATVQQLAASHQVTDNAIRRVLRQHGIQLRPVNDWDKEAAVAEYVAGESATVVAAHHGVSDSSVRDAVKAAGHPTHPAGKHTSSKRDDALIRDLYLNERLSPPTIAIRLGITARTVRRSIDEQGIPRRDDRTRCSGGANRHPEPVLRAAGDLYATGLTRTQVADRLGIGVKSVDAGIRLTGTTPRPAAHIASGRPGIDHAAALKELLANNGATPRQVRTWARDTGRDCPDWGVPPRQLVEDYLLATTGNTDRKAATA